MSASVELLQDGDRLLLSAISLHTEGVVVGMGEATFQKLANGPNVTVSWRKRWMVS